MPSRTAPAASASGSCGGRPDAKETVLGSPVPVAGFAAPLPPRSTLHDAITAATTRPEQACLPPLLAAAALPPALQAPTTALAASLVTAIRGKRSRSGVEALVREYDLSSQEGVALMCLAEPCCASPTRRPATR